MMLRWILLIVGGICLRGALWAYRCEDLDSQPLDSVTSCTAAQQPHKAPIFVSRHETADVMLEVAGLRRAGSPDAAVALEATAGAPALRHAFSALAGVVSCAVFGSPHLNFDGIALVGTLIEVSAALIFTMAARREQHDQTTLAAAALWLHPFLAMAGVGGCFTVVPYAALTVLLATTLPSAGVLFSRVAWPMLAVALYSDPALLPLCFAVVCAIAFRCVTGRTPVRSVAIDSFCAVTAFGLAVLTHRAAFPDAVAAPVIATKIPADVSYILTPHLGDTDAPLWYAALLPLRASVRWLRQRAILEQLPGFLWAGAGSRQWAVLSSPAAAPHPYMLQLVQPRLMEAHTAIAALLPCLAGPLLALKLLGSNRADRESKVCLIVAVGFLANALSHPRGTAGTFLMGVVGLLAMQAASARLWTWWLFTLTAAPMITFVYWHFWQRTHRFPEPNFITYSGLAFGISMAVLALFAIRERLDPPK